MCFEKKKKTYSFTRVKHTKASHTANEVNEGEVGGIYTYNFMYMYRPLTKNIGNKRYTEVQSLIQIIQVKDAKAMDYECSC